MKARPYPGWISRLFIVAMTMMAATGLMQMPIAKRYFLSDIPGLSWTSDFFLVHKLHYMFAAMLLFVVALVAVHWLLDWHKRLTLSPLGMTRIILLAAIIISGGLRVYRNLPSVSLDPRVILAIEYTHFGSVVIMGLVALAALIMKRSAYVGK